MPRSSDFHAPSISATFSSLFSKTWCSNKCVLGLCSRRNWSEPVFMIQRTSAGYICTVHVNNREYKTESPCPTPDLAQDSAACEAYIVCRNFSVNDGMPPGQRANQVGVVQGLPVAIGSGRYGPNTMPSSYSYGNRQSYRSSYSFSDSSSERRSSSGSSSSARICPCGYATYGAFDRCYACLRRERPYGY